MPSPTHARARSSSTALGGSAAKNFSVTRRHPMLNEWTRSGTPPARPAMTSVEPPPMSTTSSRSPGKSQEAPANERAASRSPGMTDSVTPSFASSASNSEALRASRAADVAIAVIRMRGCSDVANPRNTSRKRATTSATRCMASGFSEPVASTSSPRFVMAYSRSSSRSRPESSTSATSMRHVTVPMSMAA